MKTSELTGAALDWAVAKCMGVELGQPDNIPYDAEFRMMHDSGDLHYSTDWEQGGPIIEREKMKVYPNVGGRWSAQIRHTTTHPLVAHPVLDGWSNGAGDTPLIAAMRCYVASKLGDTVEVPTELTTKGE